MNVEVSIVYRIRAGVYKDGHRPLKRSNYCEKVVEPGKCFFGCLAVPTGFVLLGVLLTPEFYRFGPFSALIVASVSFLLGLLVFFAIATSARQEVETILENKRVRYAAHTGTVFLTAVQACLMLAMMILSLDQAFNLTFFALFFAIAVTGILGAMAVCFKWLFSWAEKDAAQEDADQEIVTNSSSTDLVPTQSGLPIPSK